MSKKSKKILAYLMFVAALCGTPAVSEARGGSGGQVKTEKASASQRGGNLSQSFISYLIRNYGFEAAKWVLLGGGGFGTAKIFKAGDLNTWARYLFEFKDADLKKAEKLMNQFKQEKEKFENEKSLFEQQRAKAVKDNEKLIGDKNALELKNNTLNAKVEKNEQKIKELENSKAKLNGEILDLRQRNDQLLNLNDEDNRKIDALLSSVIDSKMSGEFINSYSKESGWNGAYGLDQINLETYSNSQNVVKVALVEYDANFNVVGEAQKLELGTGGFFDDVRNKAKGKLGQDATNEMIAFKDVGLSDFDVPGLARYSFVVIKDKKVEKVVAAYFPVKTAQKINVENNENNENVNENNENVNENNEINGENNE